MSSAPPCSFLMSFIRGHHTSRQRRQRPFHGLVTPGQGSSGSIRRDCMKATAAAESLSFFLFAPSRAQF